MGNEEKRLRWQKTLRPHELFLTGQWIAGLRDRLGQNISSWKEVKDCLEYFSDTLKDVKNFEFIAEEAENFLIKSDSKYRYVKNAYLDPQDHQELTSTVARWEGRLKEISKSWILSYPNTHIDAAKLNKGVEAFLSHDEFNTLELLERQGLDEAASSLLFNNFTSAEFMALRTAESLLKKWYERKTGNELGRTTWGEVLDRLNQEFPKKAERPKELLLLDYLRERRNEIAHPEAISNSVQASTTFFNVISLCQTLLQAGLI